MSISSLAATTLLISVFVWVSNSSFTFAAFFGLQANWTAFPGSSLGNNIATERGTFFPAASLCGTPISCNSFTLGFLRLTNSNGFLLSIVLTSTSLSPTIVWSLNPFQPAVRNCSLSLTQDGILTVKDSVGAAVGTLGGSGAKMIGLTVNGNLVVYNTDDATEAHAGNIIWQSWDHPSDVLLPGQILRQGTALSSGVYSLTMYAGGAMMTISGEPYTTMPMSTNSTVATVMHPCFAAENSSSSSWAEFTGSSLILYRSSVTTISSKSCTFRNASRFLQSDRANDADISFLRLDADGNLRTYWGSLSTQQISVSSANRWLSDPLVPPSDVCKLPKYCGSYGLCRNGQCSCPSDDFDPIDPKNATAGCQPKNQIDCTDDNGIVTRFVRLPAFHYFLVDALAPQNRTSDQLGCESLCQASCPCVAYFYDIISGGCFLLSGKIYTLQFVREKPYASGVKIRTSINNAATLLPPPSSDRPNVLAGQSNTIFAGIVIGCLAFVFMGIIFWVWRRMVFPPPVVDKEEEDDRDEEEEEEEFLRTLPGLPPRFTYAELRAATDGFAEKLGTGRFGTVFSGKLFDGVSVAVKRLDSLVGNGGKQFRAEVATIGSISHVNLVRLRGFCADKGRRLLVYELMPNGSLDKWLFEPKASSRGAKSSRSQLMVDWQKRYAIAIGTAHGLAYLHDGCREPILHLDIKPQNILLDDKFQPKLADFGMSRLLNVAGENTRVVTAVRGTPGYLAPEWIRYSVATKKCDIYSFGMVLLELVSGHRNFRPEADDPRSCYFPSWAMQKAMEGRLCEVVDVRLKLDEVEMDEVERMIQVAFWCIQEDPSLRPSISAVAKMLEGEMTVEAPPLWLAERVPRFLEAFGLNQFEFSNDKDSEGTSYCRQCTMEISAPR